MYDKSDPRSTLASVGGGPSANLKLSAPQYGLFYKDNPAEENASGRTWYSRGQNFIVAYSEAAPGARFLREEQPDEYMVILPDRDTQAQFVAGQQTERSEGFSLVIMPPGQSLITLPSGGRIIRIFSSRATDVAERCSNSFAYREQQPTIPPLQNWPEPKGGYRIRLYSLDVPIEAGQFGRIWRSTNMMVNIAPVQKGERDLTKVSPHHHDDFEQGSLALLGTWKHHMRWPWSTNMHDWRDDEHATTESPSLTVIPPRVIHTSTWHSEMNQLIDIFAPPRLDFSLKPGWVRNEGEYPLPDSVADTA
jgi:hypothetical protein